MLDLIEKMVPDVRRLDDMRGLLYDRIWAEKAGDMELYYMYRDVAREEDREKIRRANLRYDITIIPPNMLGKEYTKTIGHYHPMAEEGLSYPEVYEVLEGEAIYFMQKEDLSYLYFVRANDQDKVIIPPNYGHITINPADKPLKMANWVCASFSSSYGAYKEKKGGAYYRTISGWVKNPNYPPLPEIRELKPTNFCDKNLPMYSLVADIERLEFLISPNSFNYNV
jgi:glucose-6-phosphate isomerase